MNKAFVREPENTGEALCPRCGSLGVAVSQATLASQLAPEQLRSIADAACYCPFPRCDVAYFDAFDRTVSVQTIARQVYPKDPTGPLCGCFGLSLDDIEADLAEGHPRRVRELIARSKSPEAACAVRSPSGQCCVPEVQKTYFRLQSERQAAQ